MPIYEFVCSECKTEFEKIVPMDTKSTPCPKCNSKDTKKKLSVFSGIIAQSKPAGCPSESICKSQGKHPSCCSCCH